MGIDGSTASASRLLPLGTMAACAGVTQKWLRQEAEAERIPCLNAGGHLLFDEATVHRLLLERAKREPPGLVPGHPTRTPA